MQSKKANSEKDMLQNKMQVEAAFCLYQQKQ